MSPKPNPEFLAALEHFATTRYDWNAPHLFVSTAEDGTRHAWDVSEVCRLAHSQLDPDEMPSIKLACLREGLRRFGMHELYERIMGEKLGERDHG